MSDNASLNVSSVYVICYEHEWCDMAEETENFIVNNKFYVNLEDARNDMIKYFNSLKAEYDECDDIDESHSLDASTLCVNMNEYHYLDVRKLNS